MQYRIAIEITRQAGALPNELIIKGYRYSQYGPVAFILNGVSAAEVNLVLDPIVPTLPLDIPSVCYVNLQVRAVVCEVLLASKAIIAITPLFMEAVERARHFLDWDGPRLLHRPTYADLAARQPSYQFPTVRTRTGNLRSATWLEH